MGILLDDPDKWLRAEAARGLGGMGAAAAPAISALARALADPEGEVGRGAAWALSQVGDAAVPAVLEVFRAGDARQSALVLSSFLGLRRERRVTDALVRELRRGTASDDAAVRRGAALSLLFLGKATSAEFASAAETLGSGERDLVLATLEALREVGREASAALPALLQVAASMKPDLEGAYLKTLASVGRRDPRLMTIYLDALRRDAAVEEAYEGLDWFGRAAVPSLLALLGEENSEGSASGASTAAAGNAAIALCRLGPVPLRAVPALLAVWNRGALNVAERRRKSEAGHCLENAGTALAAHADALAQALRRRGDESGTFLIDLLGRCGEAARPHLPLLEEIAGGPAAGEDGAESKDTDDGRSFGILVTRIHTIEALRRLGAVTASSVPLFARIIGEAEADPQLLRAVASALGDIGPPVAETLPLPVRLLDNPEENTREAAFTALARIGAPREILVPRSLEILKSGRKHLAVAALRYLAALPYEGADLTLLLEGIAREGRGSTLGVEAARYLRKLRPPAGGPPLNAPALGAELTERGVSLKWGPGIPGASGYRVFRRLETAGAWELIEETGYQGFTDAGVQPGYVYSFRVEAFNADREGRASEERKVEIAGIGIREQYPAPTGLTAEVILLPGEREERPAIRLAWEAPVDWDCRGYAVFRGRPGSKETALIGVSPTTSFVYTRPDLRFRQLYFVRGMDAKFLQSDASDSVEVAAAP